MAKIIGLGHYVPDRYIANREISDNPIWVEETLGIRERHVITYGESTSGLATVAGMKAMENAGIDKVDVIIVATSTPDKVAPSTASLVMKRLNQQCASFDINAVCSGFLFALALGDSLINSGADHVLVIGVDTYSTITDWESRDCIFFGDGAGAVVLTHGNNVKSVYITGAEGNAFVCEHNGKFRMKGSDVYDAALDLIPKAIDYVLKDCKLNISDIDYFTPHQPSTRILYGIADKIGLPRYKVLMNLDKYANTSAGTIPILLSEKWPLFQVKDKLLIAAIGAGWAYGAIIYEV